MPFLAEEHCPIPTKDINSWMFDDLKYDWDDPIYIDALNSSKRSISARQARTLIRKVVAGLRAIGLKQGDCVCLHSFNDILYPIIFLGVIAAGGVFSGTNPGYTATELAHTIRIAKIKIIITQADFLKPVLKAAQDAGMSGEKVVIFNPKGESAPEGYLQWIDLLKHGEQDWVRFNDLATAKKTEAARLFSVWEIQPRSWSASRILALPLFHAATAPAAYCTPLRAGEKAVVLPRFDMEQWLRAIAEHQITDLVVVPPVVVMAINSPLRKKYSLHSVRSALCGAAPLDAKAQARFQELMRPDAPFTQVWGMTETSCVFTMFRVGQFDITGSVGKALPNLDVKLVDDDGKDITAYDVRGELCVRGPTGRYMSYLAYIWVVNGYFENPEANARDWDKEGFFHTGDIAFIDGKTELFYIVDRKKELIKVRAFQVTPPELEGVLLSHPEIVDCAVIGVPDKVREGSELPRAYIVRRQKDTELPSAQDVLKYMRERLASYKMPEGGIVFIDSVPKTASGKILKRVLREQAKKEMGAKL